MKKKIWIVALAAVLLFTGACGRETAENEVQESTAQNESIKQQAAVVNDGRHVEKPKDYEKTREVLISEEEEIMLETFEAEQELQEELEQWEDPTLSAEEAGIEVKEWPYMEENGLEFFNEASFVTTGVRFPENDFEDFETIDVRFEVITIDAYKSDKEGCKNICIQYETSGEVWYSADGTYARDYVQYPGFAICDLNTGRVFPNAMLDGNTIMEYTLTLDIDGEPCEISYVREAYWFSGGMEYQEDGSATENLYCTSFYTFTVPMDYSGLAFVSNPTTISRDRSEAGVVNEDEKYIADIVMEDSIIYDTNRLYELLH